ncbi:hypothetical protein OEZ85_012863 [Tetradesmus obliquus]|uniref:Serine aminopeptidase S33 domain-containing protein n=1 Tax=Tetradesmus obliquus TaxID=3088 RepID=A0ABY8U3X4_TETOB|nr:hypothetical protein OEZ85_012863 [Tetradesmus obliquus]
MATETFTFTNSRGQALHAVACLPAGGAPACRAALVFLHGYAEHTGRKLHVFEQLAAAGVAVYAYDMHGHGQSEPKEGPGRALLLDWRHMVDDACDFAEHARQRHAAATTTTTTTSSSSSSNRSHTCTSSAAAAADVLWYLGGYSVGGLTAAHAVLRQQGQWAGLLLVSAALGLHTHGLLARVQAALGGLLNAALPRRKLVKGLVTQQLNPDPKWVSQYDADPLVYHGKARVCTVYQFGKAIKELQRTRQQLRLSTYVLHATGDKVTQYEAAREFAASLPAAEMHTVEGGYHDLLSGAEVQQYEAGMAGWISRSCSMLN